MRILEGEVMEHGENLVLNIGKKCIVTQSSIAGLSMKECLIVAIHTDKDGNRYEVKTDSPLYSFTTKTTFYPPTFLCKILE